MKITHLRFQRTRNPSHLCNMRNNDKNKCSSTKRRLKHSPEYENYKAPKKMRKTSVIDTMSVLKENEKIDAVTNAASLGLEYCNSGKPMTQQSSGSKVFEIDKMDKEADNSTMALSPLEFGNEFDDLFDETFNDEKKPLDFGEFRLCRISIIEKKLHFTKITVEESLEHDHATVLCYGFW